MRFCRSIKKCETLSKNTAKIASAWSWVRLLAAWRKSTKHLRILPRRGFFDASKFGINRNSLANPSEFIADFYGLSSVAFSVSTACTSGVKAIITAKRLLESGICDAVICGGVDSLNTLTINGFDSLGILSARETNPFSKNRDGINIGEGAAFFVASRDEISNLVIAGEHSNCDAFHMTQPDFSGQMQTQCVQKALRAANLSSVDYINLHGTGTQANDKSRQRSCIRSCRAFLLALLNL